jgi:pimeloyl-ACP methyl ester carboxylesterase
MESNKESEKLVTLSDALEEAGVLAFRFDFSYAGESSGEFADITYSGETADLVAAFQLVSAYGPVKIGIVGSSMGGTVALLFAAGRSDVAAIVTIAAPAHPERITERLLTPAAAVEWRRTGFTFYSGKRINASLLDDLKTIDVPSAAARILSPTLLIQGDRDEIVPPEEAHELFYRLTGEKKLHLMRGADHRLSEPRHLEEALREAMIWLKGHLLIQ